MVKPPTKAKEINPDKLSSDALSYAYLEEYKNCAYGYSYRDSLSITLFTVIIGFFAFILVDFNIVTNLKYSSTFMVVVFGFIGGGILFTLILDLHKTVSCKHALRERMQEIENNYGELFEPNILLMDRSIKERIEKSTFEKCTGEYFTVGGFMMWFTVVVFVFWLVTFFSLVLCKLEVSFLSGTCSDLSQIFTQTLVNGSRAN